MARKVIFHVYTIQVQIFMRVIIVEPQIKKMFFWEKNFGGGGLKKQPNKKLVL
jgi:hypothetical protein